MALQLIVGLGNPGSEYQHTRHNVGADFVVELADNCGEILRPEKKFHGEHARVQLHGVACHLLLPTTFMNCSGQAVAALAQFYKIPSKSILVVHDDLDLPVGAVKLKRGGGHGGHNGLRDIIAHLDSSDFLRLRFGISHPGDKNRVSDYVLSRFSKPDQELFIAALGQALAVLPDVINGEEQAAMRKLH